MKWNWTKLALCSVVSILFSREGEGLLFGTRHHSLAAFCPDFIPCCYCNCLNGFGTSGWRWRTTTYIQLLNWNIVQLVPGQGWFHFSPGAEIQSTNLHLLKVRPTMYRKNICTGGGSGVKVDFVAGWRLFVRYHWNRKLACDGGVNWRMCNGTGFVTYCCRDLILSSPVSALLIHDTPDSVLQCSSWLNRAKLAVIPGYVVMVLWSERLGIDRVPGAYTVYKCKILICFCFVAYNSHTKIKRNWSKQ